jgi:hypothetical protein
MQFCPACGVNLRDGVFFASSVVRNPDNTVQKDDDGNTARIFNIPFKADAYKARVCQYAKVSGCINTCSEMDSTQTFEYRVKNDLKVDINDDRWLAMAREILNHE